MRDNEKEKITTRETNIESEIIKQLISVPEDVGVTFKDLSNIEGFSGDRILPYPISNPDNNPFNLIAWHACSEDAIEILKRLERDKVIKIRPIESPLMTYFAYKSEYYRPPCETVFHSKNTNKIRWIPCSIIEGGGLFKV